MALIGSLLRIRYEVVQELEEGPIFHAYRVKDRVGGREVKVRLIQPPFGQEAPFLERVQEVISESSAANHPGMERLLELDEHEGTPFVISELPSGASLKEKIARLAPFSAPVSISTVAGVCEALVPIHDAGHCHGDISSSNIYVNHEGKVKVGLAGMWRAYGASKTAGAVVLPMMAPYLAPEVTQGSMPNAQSDVYSIGVLLFELLVGRYPFSADTPVAMAMKHATAPIPGIRITNPAVPAVLEEIVKKAMAKRPEDRYPDAKAFLSDLRIMQDALRFGKQLSWPIKATTPVPVPTPEPAPQLVAPRMSAIHPEPREQKIKDRQEEVEIPDRLPQWLTALGYIAGLALVASIGGYLYWNLTSAKPVRVPSLVGVNAADAENQLSKLKFKSEIIETESSEPVGNVTKTDPRADVKVDEGSTIKLYVSKKSTFVEIPPLKGKPIDEVRETLQRLGLKVDRKLDYRPNRNFERGIVIGSTPSEREKLQRNSVVKLIVSNGPRSTDDESLPKLRTYRVRIGPLRLDRQVFVLVEMTDDEETRPIYEGNHVEGDVIETDADGQGDRVVITVKYDGLIVDQKTVEAPQKEEQQ